MRASKHSIDRADERLGLSLKPFLKLASKALEEGIKHGDTVGSLKKYIDKLFLQSRQASNIRIYGEFVYLFNQQEVLITVMHLPNNLKAHVKNVKDRLSKSIH